MLPSITTSPELYESAIAPQLNISIKGEYSVGPDRNYLQNKRDSARYLRKEFDRSVPDVRLDLREGYTTWVQNPRVDRLAHVQTWIFKEANGLSKGIIYLKYAGSN
ncbi:hypothetical protein DdX_19217 [Ditylenchus destructor]|uniref:Uncharacterized protein n=1 Tax=Ditylenchus destructor TaxID=166010 RepID=A0AAD4QXF9_9BILA|nr:hypothetical protein DdX_19217 [Ditylenchus destructor]